MMPLLLLACALNVFLGSDAFLIEVPEAAGVVSSIPKSENSYSVS